MIGRKKLFVDGFSEITDLIKEYTDGTFWDFGKENLVENAIYVLGRAQTNHNIDKVRETIESGKSFIIVSNPIEGSDTLRGQIINLRLDTYAMQGRMLLIGGGDMESMYRHLQYDSFLPKIYDIPENRELYNHTSEIFDNHSKPHTFLFLNGRLRPHRKFLLQSFRISGLLDQAIWTNLDSASRPSKTFQLMHQGQDLIQQDMPIKYLDPGYEVPRYRTNLDTQPTQSFAKADLFKNGDTFDWGEVYIQPEPYIDTYFSLVTETVFSYPYSFRTEKIWKPIAIGHPWIAVANVGYYRDMRNLGFRTFGHIIDETFDTIDNDMDRIARIRDVVVDLCSSTANLKDFLAASRPVCEYNQKHLWNMREKVRQEFPNRFMQFMRDNGLTR
jgi:hypothetical protein